MQQHGCVTHWYVPFTHSGRVPASHSWVLNMPVQLAVAGGGGVGLTHLLQSLSQSSMSGQFRPGLHSCRSIVLSMRQHSVSEVNSDASSECSLWTLRYGLLQHMMPPVSFRSIPSGIHTGRTVQQHSRAGGGGGTRHLLQSFSQNSISGHFKPGLHTCVSTVTRSDHFRFDFYCTHSRVCSFISGCFSIVGSVWSNIPGARSSSIYCSSPGAQHLQNSIAQLC